MNFAIELTAEEQKMLDILELDQGKVTTESYEKNARAALTLVKLLAQRNAVPAVRLNYWNDPRYQLGRIKSSHKGLFERNHCVGEDIYRHPHFLAYLYYFLFGANLPREAISEFEGKVGNPQWVTSGDVVPIGAFARTLTRKYGLNKYDAAEEFYKLSLDLGLSVSISASIHRSVMQLK